jgi:hypothetical protein
MYTRIFPRFYPTRIFGGAIRSIDLKQAIRSRASVMNILSGVISSPRILSRKIYPNSSRTETSPMIPYVSVKIDSTSVTSPWLIVGFVITWGRVSPPPSTCITTNQWIKNHTPSSFTSSLFSRTLYCTRNSVEAWCTRHWMIPWERQTSSINNIIEKDANPQISHGLLY